MSIPFDPKELEIVRRQPSFNPAVPGTALFNFPMTEREAYKSTVLNKELVWQPYGVETGFLAPSVIPDNIARDFPARDTGDRSRNGRRESDRRNRIGWLRDSGEC